MTLSPPPVRQWLLHLEQQLTALEAGGVGYVNIAPNTALAQELAAGLAGMRVSLAPEPAPATDGPTVTAPAVAAPAQLAPENPAPAKPPLKPALAVTPAARPAPAAKRPAKAAAPATPAPGPEVPLADISTLESLQFQFRNCQRCDLCDQRNRVVFGTGNPQPRLVFVGEGPGQDEDLQGLPFVGRAGKLLTAGIAALGLNRAEVYIANVVKCRPPENRTPTPAEVAACMPILQRQLELLQPTVIVALGKTPLLALNPQSEGITKVRGQWFTYQQWPVLPTFHPAYLLRNAAALAPWYQDIKTAFRKAYPEEEI